MRSFAFTTASAWLIAFQFLHAGGSVLQPRRTTSLLINPDPQQDLPSARVATTAANNIGIDLDDIQGDVLIGMKKKKELFFFFDITNVATFKSKLASEIHPMVTTTTQLLSTSTQPISALNIAFSYKGLRALGLPDAMANVGDAGFELGQFANHIALGDITSNWVPAYAKGVHGLVMFASDTVLNVETKAANFASIMGASITERHRLFGQLDQACLRARNDGISQPTLFASTALPGQRVLQPNVFLFEGTGAQPVWTKGGSILAFRQLQQLVPELERFVTNTPFTVPGLTRAEEIALLGARMVGRWKSGAPIDLSPLHDDPALGSDPFHNNDFTYEHTGFDFTSDQSHCPFAAHTRKTLPRNDLNDPNVAIMRAGIPYGPEVTKSEVVLGVSSALPANERGLAFVSYQSNLGHGFKFIQQRWANSPNFGSGKNDSSPGHDPIIGVNTADPSRVRFVSGLDPTDASRDITLLRDFVVSRGGEYFFTPSLSAILNVLAV